MNNGPTLERYGKNDLAAQFHCHSASFPKRHFLFTFLFVIEEFAKKKFANFCSFELLVQSKGK